MLLSRARSNNVSMLLLPITSPSSVMPFCSIIIAPPDTCAISLARRGTCALRNKTISLSLSSKSSSLVGLIKRRTIEEICEGISVTLNPYANSLTKIETRVEVVLTTAG